MADKGVHGVGARPGERQRIRKLAQAALNADVTVEQVDTILTDLARRSTASTARCPTWTARSNRSTPRWVS